LLCHRREKRGTRDTPIWINRSDSCAREGRARASEWQGAITRSSRLVSNHPRRASALAFARQTIRFGLPVWTSNDEARRRRWMARRALVARQSARNPTLYQIKLRRVRDEGRGEAPRRGTRAPVAALSFATTRATRKTRRSLLESRRTVVRRGRGGTSIRGVLSAFRPLPLCFNPHSRPVARFTALCDARNFTDTLCTFN